MTTRRPVALTQIAVTIAALVIVSTVQTATAGMMDEADAAYLRADYETALMLYRAEAEQGDAPAQYNLGIMYDNGRGVPEDDIEAVRWFRLAAEQGDALAQYNLGNMYANGDGVPEDDIEAVRWYRLAAEQGHALAQYNLGIMYANGDGVPEDDIEAVRWYRLAAEQGHALAQYNLGIMYDNGRGVPEDDIEAVRWYRLAAEQGHALAQYNLGNMYANGDGVPEDDIEAVRWYRLAAEQGHALAQYNLGIMYDNGRGVPEDDIEAVRWFRLAAEQGDALAQFNLGTMYDNGRGVPEDDIEAVRWFRLAAEQGHAPAQLNLGVMYGLGVRRIWRTVSDKIRARPGECREFTMSDPFKPVDRDTPYLLPPSLQDWLPQEHLARFVVEIVDRLDLSELERAYRGRGKTPYHPSVMVALLFYGYATGVFSSRKLEQATYDSVAFRYITADTHPDHDTIAHFRKRFLEPLRGVFVQILVIAQAMGVLKIGTVSLDGTKVKANASKHKAMSWGYANRLEAQLREEVQTLLEQAARADTEASPGLDIPEELERREARLAAIERAKAEIERRAQERYEAEQAEYEEKLKRRRDTEKATGKKARGREPKAPVAGPRAKDQVNFTDEESRIMPSSEGFVQGYNAQAAVDIDSHLIVAEHVSDHTNDKQELAPALRCLDERQEAVGQPRALLADAGYFSDENVRRCEAEGIEPYIASGRERHHRPLADRLAPVPECPAQADGVAAMGHRMKTPEGRALYAKRKSTVETVFGVIKEVLGFRRFHLRGLEAVQGEWTLVCMAWNLKRMHVAVA